jgi:NAD(P)-dependent dehydrogenase (short-subunit alcohol dehydrogenase family)
MGVLDGRVVIVTGGGRGIGRAHCLELAAQGAAVVVNDLGVGVHSEEADAASPAEAVIAEITAAGGTAVADGASVTNWEGMRALVAATVGRFGRLDAVVNNAGIVRDRMITGLEEEDWDAVVAVHLKGTFALTKHACDHWRNASKRGERVTGRAINTTSGAGLLGNIGQSPYGTAKAAIAGLAIITAMEMQRYGVTANAISPWARTGMTESLAAAGAGGSANGWDPLDPSNSSPVVAWLASEDSGWLTGQVLRISGNTLWRMIPWTVDERDYRARGVRAARRGRGRRGRPRALRGGAARRRGCAGAAAVTVGLRAGSYSAQLAGRHPSAAAVVHSSGTWTTEELWARARRRPTGSTSSGYHPAPSSPPSAPAARSHWRSSPARWAAGASWRRSGRG